MVTEAVAGSIRGRLIFIKPGYADYTISALQNVGVSVRKEKTSVNLGRFTPGIYRVNPYSVLEEHISRGGEPLIDIVQVPGTTYKAILEGDYKVFFGGEAKSAAGAAPSFGNMASLAVQQAAAKLGESKAGLGETLGEFKETLDLLRHPFKDFRDFIANQDFRRLGLLQRLLHFAKSGEWVEKGSRTLRGSDAAKVAANTWLEFRYGLLPLIYTVQDLIKVVNTKALQFDRSKIRTVRSSVKRSSNTPLYRNTLATSLCGCTDFKATFTGTDSMTARACIQYRLDSPRSMMELLGLTPQYLPELVWELTRYSFVVDWWLSVGDWLGSLRGLILEPTVTVLGNTVGLKIDRRVTVTASTGVTNVANLTRCGRGEIGYYTLRSYQRLVNQSIPFLPQFKPEFKSITHSVDALALILLPILAKMRKQP